MSNKINNKKQTIFALLIAFILSSIIIFVSIIGVFSKKDNPTSNNETNLIEKETQNEINNNENINYETQNEINNNENINYETQNEIISGTTDNIPFEFVNTNFVDDFTFFTNTDKKNTNGGSSKIITSYNDYIDFMSINNYDISNELFEIINEKYFEKNVIICVVDTFEEKYQNRAFFNFRIENTTTYINFLKEESNTKIETSGYWTYMIGVSYEILGKTDIEHLPISVQVMD